MVVKRDNDQDTLSNPFGTKSSPPPGGGGNCLYIVNMGIWYFSQNYKYGSQNRDKYGPKHHPFKIIKMGHDSET